MRCFFGRHHYQIKKAELNLSPACLLSKLCYDAVSIGCHARTKLLLTRLWNCRVELRRLGRTFERGR